MKEVLEYLVKSLVSNPDAVEIITNTEGKETTFIVHVLESDLGAIIGRGGNTAQAIRTILRGFTRANERVYVKFEGKNE